MVRVKVLKIKSDRITISGTFPQVPVDKKRRLRICRKKDDDIIPELFPMPYNDRKDENGNVISRAWGFRADLPICAGARYRFVLDKQKRPDKTVSDPQEIRFGRNSMLQNIDGSFVDNGECIIKCVDNEIRIYKASRKMRLACRYRLNRTLIKERKTHLIPMRRRAIRDRAKGKPVVIVSDRADRAGDNGEALFKYLMANGYDDIYDLYFAVKKESPDYERMRGYGRVLDFGSKEYNEKFLVADKIISAGFDRWFSDAFGENYKYMADLYRFDHCFLQHGIIMDDMSKALNYSARGFDFFCTSAEPEYKSVLDGNYGYHDDEVRLTGLARYDYLEDSSEKLIVFTPTWRYYLAADTDDKSGGRLYSELIPGSDYCTFYNDLINDSRLTEAMKEFGYRGEFYMHPAFSENASDFKGNEIITVHGTADYNNIFRKASMLITDYSSVNMDFAYLNKPVIYSQFDRESFFANHIRAQGYFDYERDGFGPVCTTLKDVVDEMIRLMENGCIIDPIYTERAESFFRYRDRNNCERIAKAIFGSSDS